MLLASALAAALWAPAPPEPARIVVLLTDFGQKGEAVAICKGVMLRVDAGLRIVDLSHDVTPFDVRGGARLLELTVRYYPAGTVFVAVVDPGVGTARRAIAARTLGGHILIGPDNGLLAAALAREGALEVREITARRLFNPLDPVSTTFHGRDVFSPVGAHLASGVPFEEVGPRVLDWARLSASAPTLERDLLRGEVRGIDEPFGNLLTNLPSEWAGRIGLVLGTWAEVTVGSRSQPVRFVATFGDVGQGDWLLYPDSGGTLGLAIREGDLARTLHSKPGDLVELRTATPR